MSIKRAFIFHSIILFQLFAKRHRTGSRGGQRKRKKKKKKSVVGLTAVAASVTWRRMRFEAEGRLVKSIRCVMFRQRLGDGCLSTGFQLQQAAGR